MAKAKESRFSLKDHLFNKEKVTYLGELFHASDSSFDASVFIRDSVRPFSKLELKERIFHIAATLEKHLNSDFKIAAKQIVSALPPPLDPTKKDDDFGDYIFAPLGEYVATHGLAKQHLKTSLRTLREITQRFSMEDAIRRFINQHTEVTMGELEKWSTHKNYHVRRLVSEGTRALLPWSGRLVIDVERPLPLLTQLHSDPTRYVTRSVANHMNDISKKNADLTLQTLKQWKQLGKQDPSEFDWICRHSLRTLIKQGHSGALKFLGFRANPKIKVDAFQITSGDIRPGQTIEFSFDVTATKKESLMIDYVIDFVKANGSTAPKVHKLKQVQIGKGETIHIKKKHRIPANPTTFKLYPGKHCVSLQINGTAFGHGDFELLD